MSRWVRGIYNSAANFNMSRSLRAASGRTMDRNTELMHQVDDQPDQRDESNKSDQSYKPNDGSSTGRGCACGSTCSSTGRGCTCGDSKDRNGSIISKHFGEASELPNNHGSSCSCPLCREYLEYVEYTATISSEGQGHSSGVWISNESRNFKQPSPAPTRDDVEYVTGLQPGVTI